MQRHSHRISNITRCMKLRRYVRQALRAMPQLSAAIVVGFSGLAMAQAGRLDSTFGNGGIFITHDALAFDAGADAVALQSDGKIIVGGEISSSAGVLRLNTNGTLDSS